MAILLLTQDKPKETDANRRRTAKISLFRDYPVVDGIARSLYR
jgi:hypothetical protein